MKGLRKRIGRGVVRSARLLGSMRLAIILLVLLALACVVGGTVPQSSTTPNADAMYRSYGIFWCRLITRLALDDVFRSVWFFVLGAAFALNLAMCSTRRLLRLGKRLVDRSRSVCLGGEAADVRQVAVKTGTEMSKQGVERILRRCGFRRIAITMEEEVVASRRLWSVLAPDVVHIGVLVILLGALLGIFRQEGTFVINEWETGIPLSACIGASGKASGDCVPLPYDVRVDAFGAETYDGERVKTYWAELAFLDDGKVVRQGQTSVNRPLSFAGFGFYPWRYGNDVRGAVVRLHVVDRSLNAVTSDIELRIGETVPVPGTRLWLTALRFYLTLSLAKDGSLVDLGGEFSGDSAVLTQVAGTEVTGVDVAYRDLARPFVADNAGTASHVFILADAAIPAFIELHYSRDPGYHVVWCGFIVVMVGLAAAFYFRPIWIRATIEPTAVVVRVDGRGSAKALDDVARLIQLQHCGSKGD